jgi:hypothetical protein
MSKLKTPPVSNVYKDHPAGRGSEKEKAAAWLRTSDSDSRLPVFKKKLYVKVEEELMGMRSKFDSIDLFFGFKIDPHVDNILGEYIAFK